MPKYQYSLELETLNHVEQITSKKMSVIHRGIYQKLRELYIDFKDKDFIAPRTLQRYLEQTETNDFYLQKVKKSIIKITKTEIPE